MAVSQNVLTLSFPVGSTALNNSTNQYKAVVLTTAGSVSLPASSNVTNPLGVLVNSPTTLEVAAVAVKGVVQFRMTASTLSAGDLVAASSLGLGVTPSTDGSALGRIVYGSSGGARLVSILLQPATG